MTNELLILEFETADKCLKFIRDIDPNFEGQEVIYEIAPNDAWLFISGICDICNSKQMFFIPAIAFEDGIIGTECSECGNMSVYPKEGNWNDE